MYRKGFLKDGSKGQVTVFIILGIVILLIVALAIYLMNRTTEEKFTPPEIYVEREFEPIQNYVQQCMNQIAEEAVIKIGQHGGYIDPYDEELSGTSFDSNPLKQYDSDMIFIAQADANTAVPYWLYTSSVEGCSNCILDTKMPSMTSMARQISIYVKRHMESCLADFDTLETQGYMVIDDKTYDITTVLTDKGVSVIMDSGLLVRLDDQEGKFEKFYTEVDIPLKKYYAIAYHITASEYRTNFLENVGLYLIYTYSGRDTSKLPPMHESSNGYDIQMWSKTATKQRYSGLLLSYIAALRIPNTRNGAEVSPVGLSPSERYFYNATRLDIFNGTNLSTMAISFSYLGQDIFFDITPSNGELLVPSTDEPPEFSNIYKGDRINTYNFYYQTAYPVLVDITDEYKPNVTYTFMFSLEGTIKYNRRIKDYLNDSLTPIFWDESFVTVTYNDFDTTSGGTESNIDMSQYGLGNEFDQAYSSAISDLESAQVSSGSMNTKFCNPAQRVSGPVSLRAYDSITGESLNYVDVKLGCGDFVECKVGYTSYNRTLHESMFRQRLPTCRTGYLRLSKEGYLPKNIRISTDTKDAQNLGAVYLDPIVTKTFEIRKYYIDVTITELSDSDETYRKYTLSNHSINNVQRINDTDSVLITLERMNTDVLDEPYAQTVILSKEFGANSTDIMIAPGTYTVTAQLLDHNGVIIPKECKTICTDDSSWQWLTGCQEEEKIPEEDIVIKPAPWGGIQYDNQTLFYVSNEDIITDNILEFNVILMPSPRCFDDVGDIANIVNVSEKYYTELLPNFLPVEAEE